MDCFRCERLPRSGVRLLVLGLLWFLAVASLLCSFSLAQSNPGLCTLAAGDTGKATVNITPESPSAVLSCPTDSTPTAVAVPAGFSGTDVCQTSAVTVQGKCPSVAFKTLFPQVGDGSWWTTPDKFMEAAGTTLKIPKDSFPRYDETFYLGCADSTSNKKCVITVNVKAAAGSVNNQVVTCAYNGKTSYQVTLSKQAPSFTLNCGAQAVFHPQAADKFCTAEISSGDCTANSFTSILSKYVPNWWSTPSTGTKVFKIADDGFPAQAQTFYMACSGPQGTAGADGYCNVKVTVDASAAGGGGGTGGGPTVTTTTATKSEAYAVNHIGVGLLAVATVSGSVCLMS